MNVLKLAGVPIWTALVINGAVEAIGTIAIPPVEAAVSSWFASAYGEPEQSLHLQY